MTNAWLYDIIIPESEGNTMTKFKCLKQFVDIMYSDATSEKKAFVFAVLTNKPSKINKFEWYNQFGK